MGSASLLLLLWHGFPLCGAAPLAVVGWLIPGSVSMSEAGLLIMIPYCCFPKLLMFLWLSEWMKFHRLLWRFVVFSSGRTAYSGIRARAVLHVQRQGT